jgi:nucleotide-binding universal stress UspA family protein
MHELTVLICYDGSESSRHAIKSARNLLGPRRAIVLDVAPLVTPVQSVALTSSVVPGSAFEDDNLADATDRARAGTELAREAGFAAEACGELGAPTWQAIVDAAEEVDAGVIVIGSRGLTGVRELFEGSVSHEVAGHSRRPVLIVPPDGRD